MHTMNHIHYVTFKIAFCKIKTFYEIFFGATW